MDAGISQRAYKMYVGIILTRIVHGAREGIVLEKYAVVYRFVDTREILVDNPSCAKIYVSCLGIAVLTGR
jgi:hypothetical protein